MLAFMAIILISFTILACIVSSIVRSYAADTTEADLSKIAKSALYLIRYDYSESEFETIEDYFDNQSREDDWIISAVTKYSSDMFLVITDASGHIICTDTSISDGYIRGDFPSEYASQVTTDGILFVDTDFSGAFPSEHYVYALAMEGASGDTECIFYACSSSAYTQSVVGSLIRMTLMACMWVMIAAIIACYFISERIVRPIRSLSRAAKSFATGHFDVRVPVVGDSEISELAMNFNNMAESLATLEESRSTFLANVSHDLRTPMFTISGYIDGILDGAIPPEKQTYYLGIVASEVRRLSRLVSSLLELSRMEAGERKFNMQPFDICEMARQILLSFETRIEEKHLDVSFLCDEEKEMVIGDSDAIHRILYNVCDNAVKFSCDGGKYRIQIRERDKKIYVSVFNEGEGIAPEDIPHVFDRFYKGDKSRGKDKTGVGLGMYIAKMIMDAHHETISVSSRYGENCEFTFTLRKAGK
jgi:signal transduction histidine kinase